MGLQCAFLSWQLWHIGCLQSAFAFWSAPCLAKSCIFKKFIRESRLCHLSSHLRFLDEGKVSMPCLLSAWKPSPLHCICCTTCWGHKRPMGAGGTKRGIFYMVSISLLLSSLILHFKFEISVTCSPEAMPYILITFVFCSDVKFSFFALIYRLMYQCLYKSVLSLYQTFVCFRILG
jgi:hypothetical protein